jgi:hypothetical protein
MSLEDIERRFDCAGPFVINLHASVAPIGLPSKGPVDSEHARLYQIQRVDDGRIRYRLRLGPFATEQEAEAVLAEVRLEYPGALTVTAAPDDLHAISLVRGKANPGGPSADVRSTDTSADARNSDKVLQPVLDTRRFTLPITADPVAPAALPPAAAPVPPPILTLVEDAPAAAVAAPQRAAVSVASDIASMQALIAAIDTDTAPSKTTKPPVLHSVPAAKVAARRDDVRAATPSLESTQTLRPLTPLELGEHEAPRWFVVQLALSDDTFDPDALPHLDIFSLYRLYTVIGMDQGRLVHALRLGFFAEEVGARAVANYLAAFYDEASVKRVSVAERDRFADQRVEARKDVGATGRHLAIEITNELVVRGRRSSR